MKFKLSKKILLLTLAISISSVIAFSQIAFAKPSFKTIKNLDGIYTLKEIKTATGEIKYFDYGGELSVHDYIATLETPSESGSWNTNNKDCYFDESNNFCQIDSETNSIYTFAKVK